MNAEENKSGILKHLAAPLIVAFAIICCLAAPLILAGIGSVAIGSTVGWIAGALVFALACLFLLRRSQRRC